MNDPFYLQLNYAKILGSKLEKFKVKRESSFLAAARCPICNEGTSKTKTRFYIYEKDNSINVRCHNCEISTTLINFLRLHYKPLFDEYVFDKLKIVRGVEKPTIQKTEFIPSAIIKNKVKLDLPLVSELSIDHPAAVYVTSRKLPDYPFQFAERFFEFSKQYNKELVSGKTDEPRLIIPFFDRQGNVFAYQGRSFNPFAAQKYITIIVNAKHPKIFGLDRIDFTEKIILVEGPIDSLFLPNAIASVNASLTATANKLIAGLNIDPSRLTLVFDNEPRSKHICLEYKKAISFGYKIVIWPKSIKHLKDINDIIIAGLSPINIINKNTFQGLEAQLNFNQWKRV